MLKQLLLVALLLLAVGLGAIGAWHWADTRASLSTAERFKTESLNRKLIPIQFEVTVPESTPADQDVYLSGSEPALGNWDASGVKLARGDDGTYRGATEVMSGLEYTFKITRGTWGTVEKGIKGEEIEDRPLKCEEPQTVAVAVATWVDGGKTIPGRITITGELRVHQKFRSELLGNERHVAVWLPPDYEDNEEQRYGVLYMHDGQNLFNEFTSYKNVEWQLDEAAQKLIEDGKIPPVIIVGIYNSPERTAEFAPPPAGKGHLYGRFIVEELKPFIDRVYRTKPEKEHTALGGASLGGLVSLFMAQAHKDTFSQLALLTPHLRLNDRRLDEIWGNDTAWLQGKRIWIDMSPSPAGYYSGDDPLGDARAVAQAMQNAGLQKDVDLHYLELPEGEHQEDYWQERVEPLLLWMYGKEQSPPTAAP